MTVRRASRRTFFLADCCSALATCAGICSLCVHRRTRETLRGSVAKMQQSTIEAQPQLVRPSQRGTGLWQLSHLTLAGQALVEILTQTVKTLQAVADVARRSSNRPRLPQRQPSAAFRSLLQPPAARAPGYCVTRTAIELFVFRFPQDSSSPPARPGAPAQPVSSCPLLADGLRSDHLPDLSGMLVLWGTSQGGSKQRQRQRASRARPSCVMNFSSRPRALTALPCNSICCNLGPRVEASSSSWNSSSCI